MIAFEKSQMITSLKRKKDVVEKRINFKCHRTSVCRPPSSPWVRRSFRRSLSPHSWIFVFPSYNRMSGRPPAPVPSFSPSPSHSVSFVPVPAPSPSVPVAPAPSPSPSQPNEQILSELKYIHSKIDAVYNFQRTGTDSPLPCESCKELKKQLDEKQSSRPSSSSASSCASCDRSSKELKRLKVSIIYLHLFLFLSNFLFRSSSLTKS